MRTITLSPVKNQIISLSLGENNCTLKLVQRESALYIDVSVDGEVVTQGVPCLYANRIIRYRWLGFPGDLFFMDTEGQNDPRWDGLGSRYLLFWLEESDIVQ